MRIRLEDMVDMGGWKGLEYHWGMSKWNRTRSFNHNFPIAVFSSSVAKLATLPIDRYSFTMEVRSLSQKWSYDQILKESTLRRTLHPIGPFIPSWSLTLPLNETMRTFLLNENPENHPIRTFLSGALASVPGTALVQPLHMACCACSVESIRKGHNTGLISNLENRYIQGGYRYFYVGMKASLITNSIFTGLMFSSYTTMKNIIPPSNGEEENSLLRRFLFGSSAVLLSSILVLPLEVSKREIIYQSCTRHPDNVENFGRILKDCKGKVLQRSGHLLMQVPAIAVALILFEGYKNSSNE